MDLKSLMIMYDARKIAALNNNKYKIIVDSAFDIRVKRKLLKDTTNDILNAVASMTSTEYKRMIDRLQ